MAWLRLKCSRPIGSVLTLNAHPKQGGLGLVNISTTVRKLKALDVHIYLSLLQVPRLHGVISLSTGQGYGYVALTRLSRRTAYLMQNALLNFTIKQSSHSGKFLS